MASSSALEAAKRGLLTLSVVRAGGTVAGVIARRLRAPDVAVYLLFGILPGPNRPAALTRALAIVTRAIESALIRQTGLSRKSGARAAS